MLHPKHIEPVTSDRYTFDYAAQLAFDLEAVLRQHGVSVERGSLLERICLSVLQTIEFSKAPPAADNTDIRPEFRAMIGLADLAANLISVRNAPEFASLVPHLQLLNAGSPLQNVRTGFDDASNKLFELLVACWALRAGQDVSVESPRSSGGGSHPDVIVTLEGERWGLACKVPASDNPKSIADLIESGARQLIATPGISRGLVVLNLRSTLNHDRYWPLEGIIGSATQPAAYLAFKEQSVVVAAADEEVAAITLSAMQEIAARGQVALATEALDIVGILVFAHTTAGLEMSLPRLQPGYVAGDAWKGPMPTSLKLRRAAVFTTTSGANERAVAQLAHQAALNPMATIREGDARWRVAVSSARS